MAPMFVSLRQGCLTRGGRRAGRLGWWVGTGPTVRERGLIVPRHPVGGGRGDDGGVTLSGDQILARGDLVQFGGVDQTHEDIADARAVEGTIEECVFPVQDGFF